MDPRLLVLAVGLGLAGVVIVLRLFVIQVLDRSWYRGLALGQRELVERIAPERGMIVVQDRRSPGGQFPIATNERTYTIYAVPKDIRDPQGAARTLAPLLHLPEDTLRERLAKPGDPYEPLVRRASIAERDAIAALRIPGVAAEATLSRFYPDGSAMAHLTGFVGDGPHGISGRYGIEAAYDQVLSGTPGVLESERDPLGRWIVFGQRSGTPAIHGATVALTIERELQLEACRRLEAAVTAAGGSGGTMVILHPMTGAVRALCSVPAFDPNRYGATTDLARFHAPAVTGAYEPGSVFKPMTMAAAIDAGVVHPDTTFTDTGRVVIGRAVITNSNNHIYGESTMADVLRFSINTGTVFVARKIGMDRFRAAVERFGFGALTDIELPGESAGDTSNLARREEVYLATSSYGQGITVTPLQLAVAYAAIANGGNLMQPHVVDAVMLSDGTRRRVEPRVIRRVMSARTATLLQGMLVSVVRDGYPKRAGVRGYLVGGKTGTAQIPLPDRPGYSADTIHTFAGIGAVDHPTFAMVVRIDRPTVQRFADSTAAPLFGEMAKYLLEYDGILPKKN
ncbi:penicillin-binding protein 2 [Candidatus Uhrbacteria bacterium]|nr:penicillin-binding protein 2 [Candidatus Uhrbacteria bacterium]